MKTEIKICGITSPEEASYIHYPEVSFMGMVLFVPGSRRNVTLEKAKEIMVSAPEKVKKVAVTVSPDLEQIRQIENAGFDYVQVHGELKEEVLQQITIPIIRAVNMDGSMMTIERSGKISYYLFDAAAPGSGRPFEWDMLSKFQRGNFPWALAGGLNEHNVLDAILTVHPQMVDVSSGVEHDHAGGKDPEKIRNFIQAVEKADLMVNKKHG